MNKFLICLLSAVAIVALAGCGTPNFQPGGAYSGSTVTTNTDGTLTTNQVTTPQTALYVADASYKTAYDIIDGAMLYEFQNRAALQAVSPQIKTTLDKIRPVFIQIDRSWAAARQAYKNNPTPAGLTQLQNILSQAQALVASAQAVLVQMQSTTTSTH